MPPAQHNRGFRVATWNLERPTGLSDPRADVIRRRLEAVAADIWILTESHSAINPGPRFEGRWTRQLDTGHQPGECRSAIWTNQPILRDIPTYDPWTAVCIEVETPLGPAIVYGTIIPYGGAGTKHGYWFDGQRRTDTASWQLHRESIDGHRAEWQRLRTEFPHHHLIVGGDFNQSRDGHRWGKSGRQWSGTNQVREHLSQALSDSDLECVTEVDFVDREQLTTRSTVDHICLSRGLAEQLHQVGAWEPGSLPSRRVSDHNGVHVDLAP